MQNNTSIDVFTLSYEERRHLFLSLLELQVNLQDLLFSRTYSTIDNNLFKN